MIACNKYKLINICQGCARDWPDGRGVLYRDDMSLVVLISFEDHLRILSVVKAEGSISPLKDALHLIQRAAKVIADHVVNNKTLYEPFVPMLYSKLTEGKYDVYETSKVFGNLTTSIFNCGIAMNISMTVKVPNLASDRIIMNEICRKLKIRPNYPEDPTPHTDFYTIYVDNKFGVSILNTIQQCLDGIASVIEIEKQLEDRHVKVEEFLDLPHTPPLPRPTSAIYL